MADGLRSWLKVAVTALLMPTAVALAAGVRAVTVGGFWVPAPSLVSNGTTNAFSYLKSTLTGGVKPACFRSAIDFAGS